MSVADSAILIMSGQIFISYRREDSSAWAGRLYDRLKSRFPENPIFMDVDSVDPGVDFVEALEESMGDCDVLIAVIGPHWLSASDRDGKRRLDQPEDLVRIEVGTALKRGIRVIPVLVDGASVPRAGELPEDLKTLVRRNALEISHTRFSADANRLVSAVERALESSQAEQQRKYEEQERVEAERKDKERQQAEAEQREVECHQQEVQEQQRLRAKQQLRAEQERLQAEQQREREDRLEDAPQSQLSSPVTPSTPPAQTKADKPSAETPRVVHPVPHPVPPKQVTAFLAIAAVLVLAGLIYLAIRASQSSSTQPAPIAAVTPSPATIATPPVEEKAPLTPEVAVQPTAKTIAPVAVAIPSPSISGTQTKEEMARRALGDATKEHPWVNSLGMKFVPVPGTQVLFSVWDTRVQDFEAFVADTKYDATRGMWSIGKNGWEQRGATWREPGFSQGPTHPVVGVNWNDAKKFCEWLTGREQGSGMLPRGCVYRLPTDAEWSAGIGLQGEKGNSPQEKSRKIELYPWGKKWPPPKGAGNYAGEEFRIGEEPSVWAVIEAYNDGYPRTSPVGSFAANANGLYDMGGNVGQWCEDWYNAAKTERVSRGASWLSGAFPVSLLASYRDNVPPDNSYAYLGFRCVVGAESSR